MQEELDKLRAMLLTMSSDNLALAFELAAGMRISLRPIYEGLAEILSVANFQASVGWMNLPLPILLPQIQRIFSLSIEYSTARQMPAELGFLQGALLIEISHSDYERLPEEILYMRRLMSCSLLDVPLNDLPASLARMPALRNLYLHQLAFRRLPPVLGQCRQLRTLSLSDNPQLHQIDWELLTPLLGSVQRFVFDECHRATAPDIWRDDPRVEWKE